MDERDKFIIQKLTENARIPLTQIASELGITETAVRKRIQKLEDRGVIESYTIQVNPKKIGFSTVALVGIDTEPDKFVHVLNNLKVFSEIREICTTTGDHMIMTEVWASNMNSLNEFITNRIEQIEGVTRVCPAIILEKIKIK